MGFAVSRTVFWDQLVTWRSNKTTREQAVLWIARRYLDFADVFAAGRTDAGRPA